MSEHKYGMDKKRGRFGTNVGDFWLAPGSDLQRRFDAEDRRDDEGRRVAVVVEIREFEDGPQETVYATGDIFLVADAAEGFLRLVHDRERFGEPFSEAELQYASDWIKAASEEDGW